MIVKAVGLLADPPATPLPLPRKVRQAASHPSSSSSWSLPRLEKAGQIHEQRREFLDNANTETLEMHREKKKKEFFFSVFLYIHTHTRWRVTALDAPPLPSPPPRFTDFRRRRPKLPNRQGSQSPPFPWQPAAACQPMESQSRSLWSKWLHKSKRKESVLPVPPVLFFFSCTGMINRRRRRPPAPPLACCHASEGSSWTRVM